MIPRNRQRWSPAWMALAITLFSSAFLLPATRTAQQPPDSGTRFFATLPARAVGTGGGCSLQGAFVRIPSRVAGAEGIVVRISAPQRPRYGKGAPVAVHVLSAQPSVTRSIACLSEAGFVDVGFLCPGRAAPPQAEGTVWRSGGTTSLGNPIKGGNCIEALGDVLAFATGRTASLDGKTIQQYAPGVPLLTDNAGVVGWSIGGYWATLAMANFGERFTGLKWYASWESPFAFGEELGDHGSAFQSNPFHDAKTGTIDFSRLRFSAQMRPFMWLPVFRPPLPGGLFLDGDGDGEFKEGTDFGFHGYLEFGPPAKLYYSIQVTRAARERNLFPSGWPAHIATVEETKEYAKRLDTGPTIKQAVRNLPHLAVLVFESEQNHGDDNPDHLRAIVQTNGWLDAGARWVRFQPDLSYLIDAMGRSPSRSIQNPAGRRLDRNSIRGLLEAEDRNGGPTDKEAMSAAVSELADRTYYGRWSATLDKVLISPRTAK